MILDSNAKFCDGNPTVISNLKAINTGFSFASREKILLLFRVTKEFIGGTSMTFKLQESDSKDGTFTDVASSEFIFTDEDLKLGATAPYRYLPKNIKKKWLKFVATAEGTFTDGEIIAALVREEDMPYEDGLYIDKGIVKG